MKTDIQNIDDLRAERARLKNQMELSKLYMQQQAAAIKTELNPARQAVGVIGDMLTSPRKGLLNLGVGLGVDTIIRRGLLARAGWLPRLIIPLLARNLAANLIQKNRTSLVENSLLWVKKVTDKPEKAHKQPFVQVNPKKRLNGAAASIMS